MQEDETSSCWYLLEEFMYYCDSTMDQRSLQSSTDHFCYVKTESY